MLERGGRRFTVRPEKIRLQAPDEPVAAGAHAEEGRIRDVVYVGMVTRYGVDLDGGGGLTVVSQNLESTSTQVLERRGARVRLSWRPEHVVDIQPGTTEGTT